MTDPTIPDDAAMSLWFWPWSAASAAARGWSADLAPQNLWQSINRGWTFGNVIVSNQNSKSPETEREIVSRFSYGHQLGRMMDVLAVLVSELPRTAANRDAIDGFRKLRDEIGAIKDRALERRLDALRRDLAEYRRHRPDDYATLAAASAGT